MVDDRGWEGAIMAGGVLLAVLSIGAPAANVPEYAVMSGIGVFGGFLIGAVYGIRKVRAEGAQAILEDANQS